MGKSNPTIEDKHFPFDCKGCEHFKARDMSVDDYVLRCELLEEEVDECDAWMYAPGTKCPMGKE